MTNIQNFAKQAKSRMKSGYWNGYSEAKKSAEDKIIEVMYNKVCDMMESREIITNPIGRLMDMDYLSTLDEDKKSLYVLQVSRLYVLLKQKYLDTKLMQKI